MIDELRVTHHGDSLCIAVHLQPRARQNGFAGLSGDALKVRVAVPPVDDKANVELVRFLAEALGLAARDVRLLRGQKSRHKTVAVNNMDEEELRRRLAQYLV